MKSKTSQAKKREALARILKKRPLKWVCYADKDGGPNYPDPHRVQVHLQCLHENCGWDKKCARCGKPSDYVRQRYEDISKRFGVRGWKRK